MHHAAWREIYLGRGPQLKGGARQTSRRWCQIRHGQPLRPLFTWTHAFLVWLSPWILPERSLKVRTFAVNFTLNTAIFDMTLRLMIRDEVPPFRAQRADSHLCSSLDMRDLRKRLSVLHSANSHWALTCLLTSGASSTCMYVLGMALQKRRENAIISQLSGNQVPAKKSKIILDEDTYTEVSSDSYHRHHRCWFSLVPGFLAFPLATRKV